MAHGARARLPRCSKHPSVTDHATRVSAALIVDALKLHSALRTQFACVRLLTRNQQSAKCIREVNGGRVREAHGTPIPEKRSNSLVWHPFRIGIPRSE
eukprot:4309216-Pleurochrysis_carterae.AAC.5